MSVRVSPRVSPCQSACQSVSVRVSVRFYVFQNKWHNIIVKTYWRNSTNCGENVCKSLEMTLKTMYWCRMIVTRNEKRWKHNEWQQSCELRNFECVWRLATKDGVITTDNTLIQLNKIFNFAHDQWKTLKSNATQKATHTVVHLHLHDATGQNDEFHQLKRSHSYKEKTFERKRKSKPDYEASNTTM